VDPGGFSTVGFRQEITNFICLSPAMSITYRLSRFHRFLAAGNRTYLSEDVVLGTALDVARGEVSGEASGVEIAQWDTSGGSSKFPHEQWLRQQVREVREAAEARGGVSAGLMLDKNGFEVSSFGVDVPMFAQRPRRPIREVIILLGGPFGIEDNILPGILVLFKVIFFCFFL
ncbi:unnamed protein product, partial [Polarella glacialis]